MRIYRIAHSLFVMCLFIASSSCADGRAQAAADTTGMWTGSSHITMSRATSDITIGYTMQGSFWFRVDGSGNVKGRAYAAYQPTFDPAGLNGKISMAKSVVSGALSLLPGGEIAVVGKALKRTAEGAKTGSSIAVSGLIGVVGRYSDPEPIRDGAITGTLRNGKLTLKWADPQPGGIPVKIALQYIHTMEPLITKTLEIHDPWHKPATIDPASDGRFAIAQERHTPDPKDGTTESLFAYWSATRVE